MDDIYQRKELPCRCLSDAARLLSEAAHMDANKVKERNARDL
jgi:hypothetical protein